MPENHNQQEQQSSAQQTSSQTTVPNTKSERKLNLKLDPAAIDELRLQLEDIDFINDSRTAMLAKTTPYAKWALYIVAVFIIVALSWFIFANVDEVARGMGKVVPYSQVQIIQNLEGGILEKVLVREGDAVKRQQVVAKLDDTTFASQYQQSYAKHITLLASIARLEAETTNKTAIDFPKEVLSDPKLVIQENNLFKSKMDLLKNSIRNLQENYRLAQKELDITAPLVKQGVLSQVELLRLQRTISEIQTRIDSFKDNFYETESSALDKDRDDARVLSESLAALRDRMDRTFIRSPVDGVVKQIIVNTIGGVVKPGEPIMEIVPVHDKLVIEVVLNPSDIAFVHVGQKALVRITAYDYSIYGGLHAKVTNISADTSNDQKGNSFYEVKLETDKSYLGSKVGALPIMPGMTASVDIITGKRSVMHYILKPILRAKEKALRER